jgi:hypothetical protein
MREAAAVRETGGVDAPCIDAGFGFQLRHDRLGETHVVEVSFERLAAAVADTASGTLGFSF